MYNILLLILIAQKLFRLGLAHELYNVFTGVQASQFLVRSKRANDGVFEETKQADLQRECYDERCNPEEMDETWEALNKGNFAVAGGEHKAKLLRQELQRLQKFTPVTPECRTTECGIYYTVLNQPCDVNSSTFLLFPEFSISSWNPKVEQKSSEICHPVYTQRCLNGYSQRTCECKAEYLDSATDDYCTQPASSSFSFIAGILFAVGILAFIIYLIVSRFILNKSSDEPTPEVHQLMHAEVPTITVEKASESSI